MPERYSRLTSLNEKQKSNLFLFSFFLDMRSVFVYENNNKITDENVNGTDDNDI